LRPASLFFRKKRAGAPQTDQEKQDMHHGSPPVIAKPLSGQQYHKVHVSLQHEVGDVHVESQGIRRDWKWQAISR
jgi:hypothetical protein